MDSTHIRMLGTPSLTILRTKVQWGEPAIMDYKHDSTSWVKGYIDGKIALPATPPDKTPDSTPIYSTTLSIDEWHFCDQLAQGHITLNCTDVAGLGVKTTGTANEAWDSIQTEWGRSTDMHCSHAQEMLNGTVYITLKV